MKVLRASASVDGFFPLLGDVGPAQPAHRRIQAVEMIAVRQRIAIAGVAVARHSPAASISVL